MRVPNFDVLLVQWARSKIGRPFVWGETDCGSLVRDSQVVLLGSDPFEDLPAWTNHRGAARVLKPAGALETLLYDAGLRPLPRNFAQTGDVLVFPGSDKGLPQTSVVVGAKLVTTAPGERVSTCPIHAAPPESAVWGFRE